MFSFVNPSGAVLAETSVDCRRGAIEGEKAKNAADHCALPWRAELRSGEECTLVPCAQDCQGQRAGFS